MAEKKIENVAVDWSKLEAYERARAAAPELLTALQSIQAWLDAAPPLPADRALWDPLFVKAHDLMCAAISKAEGLS